MDVVMYSIYHLVDGLYSSAAVTRNKHCIFGWVQGPYKN